jgi:LysM repeat protein
MAPRGKPGSRSATRKRMAAKKAAVNPNAFTPENIKAAAEKREVENKKKQEGSKKRRATRAANKSKAANKAAMKAAAKPVSLGARLLGRLLPAAGAAITGAEVVGALKEKAKTEKERAARGTRIAKEAEKMAVKPREGQSPTDAMRQASKGREVLEPAKRAASKYKVKAGDTLSQIAKKNGTTVRAIMKASGIENANKIKVGQQIVIPDDAKRKGPYGDITKKELKSGKYNTSKTPKFGKDFSYGGSVGKKTVKRKMGGSAGSKPKGVGCAQRGYGKAMK